MSTTPAPLPPLLSERLVDNTAALVPGVDLAVTVEAYRVALTGPDADALGPLVLRASQAEELRPLADPEGVIAVALVADQGLLALQEARHAIQDDAWITLDHVEIALPSGFSPADSTRALLEELAFTVPTYVEVPRTGFDTALDVLADDGVERATYRCGGHGTEVVPTDGELAAFVHGCLTRNVPFTIRAGLEHAVRGGNGDGAHHGALNVLAAVAAAQGGASTTDLATVLETTDAATLLRMISAVQPRAIRKSFHGFGSPDINETLLELHALGALETPPA